MEQMCKPDVPTAKEVKYGMLDGHFFRRKKGFEVPGAIFFASTRSAGGPVYCFRVNKDATVNPSSDIVALYPTEIVEVVDPKDIGIKGDKIIWGK